ncbi:MAG TPA: hypothetical protein VGC29_04065, partial [Flavisolibacter sp.]
LVLHCSILLKIVPYQMVWGGRLKSDQEMYRFEFISIIINMVLLFFIIIYSNLLDIGMPGQVSRIILWFMTIVFVLNTFGNAVSKNKWEQRLFTPLTILMALFSFVLAYWG